MQDKDDPWAMHYHIAFMTGKYVGILLGLLIGIPLGAGVVLLITSLAI